MKIIAQASQRIICKVWRILPLRDKLPLMVFHHLEKMVLDNQHELCYLLVNQSSSDLRER